MRNNVVGRVLVRSRRIWRDLVFRGLAFLSLTILAVWHPWNYSDNIQGSHSQEPAEGRRVDAEERLADYTFWLDLATVILAASTLGLWIVTWFSLSTQRNDMRRSLKISADSAHAAKKSAEAIPTLQRAYVYVDNMSVTINRPHTTQTGTHFRKSEITIT